MNAYVLIRAEADNIETTRKEIRDTNRVISAHGSWGQPDIVAFVAADTQGELSQLVLSELQAVEGVTSTSTHTVIQFA